MKSNQTALTLFLPAFCVGMIGCVSQPTVGDRLMAEGGTGSRALGERWNLGQQLVVEGEKLQDKGEDMISDGKKMVNKGEARISEGQKIQAEAQAEATRAGYLKKPAN